MKRIIGLVMLLAGCSPAENKAVRDEGALPVEPGVALTLAEYRAERISNINYALTFRVPEEQSSPIAGHEVATFTLSRVDDDLQFDFRESGDKVTSVAVNGLLVDVDHRAEHLIIPQTSLKAGENTVEIEFIAGDTSLNRSPEYLYTLFVPDRARTAFPLFDQPNLKATYDLTLDLPASWQALANGPLEAVAEEGDRRIHTFKRSDLLASYLFSFVAGEFEVVTRTMNGREMTLLHRETDPEKIARNLDDIFQLHADALLWLEDYTGIPYPFQKFDFAAIPAFQYGGMEHVGAIQYRASTLFLDEDPSETRLLRRASLIAHETAHMWFGDLVTMDWFDDVWTKEVFANFMAGKIVNPSFPTIDHDLNFLLSRYPPAYAVDRTAGANPIRQPLPNLNEAGTLYGGIIYNKAPIMMRQLELLLGEEAFQDGMRAYLREFSNGNATWPDLVRILDERSAEDLLQWSEVWVNTPGRPTFELTVKGDEAAIRQRDPAGNGRVWPQQFSYTGSVGGAEHSIESGAEPTSLPGASRNAFVDSDGLGYGLFPVSLAMIQENYARLSDLQKGVFFINLNEQMLEGNEDVSPVAYARLLVKVAEQENNQLLLNIAFAHLQRIYWSYLSDADRREIGAEVEGVLWEKASNADMTASQRKIFYNAYRNLAISDGAIENLYGLWDGSKMFEGLSFSSREMMTLAATLAIKNEARANTILEDQLARLENPDERRRFRFLTPALSPNIADRDAFFESLKAEENRAVENWVQVALGYLHHPLRRESSEKYILPSLELMEEIQRTGDIFFPTGWAAGTLGSHISPTAAATVTSFLAERPDYNYQLKLKILQSADPLMRAQTLLNR